MNNTLMILFCLFILSALTESKPRRHKHRHRHRYESKWYQDSEEEYEYDNRSTIYNGRPRPTFNSEIDNNSDNNDLDGEITTRNLPYPRPPPPNLEQSNRGIHFGGYGSDRSGRTNNHRPFRSDLEEEQGGNSQRSYEMGDFGNGHHNVNTFNIHKKIIYID